MNYLNKNLNFTTIEEGLAQLENAVKIRNDMGGDLFWGLVNEDCTEIATKLKGMDGFYDTHKNYEKIATLLSHPNNARFYIVP